MIQMTVQGMSCNHCVGAVTRAIQALDAGAAVNVDLPTGQVSVDTTRLNRDQLAAAIEEAGYEVRPAA